MASLAGPLLYPLAATAMPPDRCEMQSAKSEPAKTEAGSALTRANERIEAGDHAGALASYEEAERLAREGSEAISSLLARAGIARSLIELGRIGHAAQELDETLAALDGIDEPGVRAQLQIHLGRSLVLLDERVRAAGVFDAAWRDAQRAADARLESYALGYRAEIYEDANRTEDALALTRRAVLAAQRAESPDSLYRWQWQLARIQRRSGESDAALSAYRAAVGTIRAAKQVASREVEPLYEEFVDSLLNRAIDARGDAQQALFGEARTAMEDLNATELRDYFRDSCLDARRKATPDEIPGTVVLYPILLPDRVELIVSRSGMFTRYVSAVGRKELTSEVRAFRKTLEKRTTHQYLRHAHLLYDWLIRPLERELAFPGVEAFVIIPGGPLRTIPFAALRDQRAGKFLIEKLPVAIAPGLTLTDPSAIDRSSTTLLAAGVSEPVQGFRALPYVARELSSVTSVFPGRRLVDEDFVLKRFESEISERPFGIVHIASHGEFLPDSSESFLLTYDGKLSMNQLADLIARTQFRVRGIELLTLSACETAAGNDRSALGLAGVALRAGARSALATLWSVNDRAAAGLVIDFYTQLADPSVSRAEALRRAQLKTLGNHAFRHPSYWSPYILISSWM